MKLEERIQDEKIIPLITSVLEQLRICRMNSQDTRVAHRIAQPMAMLLFDKATFECNTKTSQTETFKEYKEKFPRDYKGIIDVLRIASEYPITI